MKGKFEVGYENELFHAILWGKMDEFERLVEGGADVRAENDYALKIAEYYHHFPVIANRLRELGCEKTW